MSQGLLVLMCGWMVLPIRLYAGAPSIGNTCHVRRHALRNRAENNLFGLELRGSAARCSASKLGLSLNPNLIVASPIMY